jgi:essential nuclear protein 1
LNDCLTSVLRLPRNPSPSPNPNTQLPSPSTMPKAPKSPAVREQRHNPLAEEYAPSDPWKNKAPKRQKRDRGDKEDEQKYVDSKSSRKILDIGRELEEEDERENQVRRPKEANPAFDFETRMGEDDLVGEDFVQGEDDEEAWGEDDEEVEEVEIDANDLAAWNKFIPTDDNPIAWPGQEAQPSGPGTDLAALILEKIAAHEAGGGGEVQQPKIQGGGAPEDAIELPEKVVEGKTAPTAQPSRTANPPQCTQRSA